MKFVHSDPLLLESQTLAALLLLGTQTLAAFLNPQNLYVPIAIGMREIKKSFAQRRKEK